METVMALKARLFISLAAAVVFPFAFSACGDETTTENIHANANVVTDVDDLPICEKSNEGEQVFITNDANLRVCANGKWYSASTNSDGSFNFHCSTETLADSSGLKIICGGDSIGVVLNEHNGKNGSGGKNDSDSLFIKSGVDGKNGISCTAVALADNSGMKIVCGGDSVGVVLNGTNGVNGKDGKNGTDGKNGISCTTVALADNSGMKIVCGGDSVGVVLNGTNGVNGKDGKNGTDGKNGISCTTVALADNSGMKIVCGDDSVGVVLNGSNGMNGKNGENGTDGKNGTSCTAVTLADNSGMKVVCGDDSVGVVLNGKNGIDGKNGSDGAGCVLKEIGVNTLRIVCGADSATFKVNEVLNPNSSSSVQPFSSSSSSALNGIVENTDELALCNASNKNARVFVEQNSMYYTCDSVKWEPDSARDYLVKSVSILGAAQKGPFKFGSPLKLRELRLYNDTLRYSGIKYVDEISSNKGNYVIPKVSLVYPYAEITVRGLWRNEVSGDYSTDSMTLQSLTDLSSRTEANVNLLTHLEYARAMKLVDRGYSVAAAKKQADYEIMTALGFATTIKFSEELSIFEDYDDNLWYDAANATLLAMSVLFMENWTDAEILAAIESFRLDIADDGEWNATGAEKNKAAMADWAEAFDKTIVRANVKSWNILEIPDYEQYLDMFWNNVYGLGGCASTRYNVVAPVTNQLSANYNVHYICKSTGWQKATDLEKDTFQWSTGKEGDVRTGNINTDKFYVYENGKWRASTGSIENDLGACVTSRNGEVGRSGIMYYICKSKKWTEATVLEYDTYGWIAGTEGEMREGSVNPSNHYVYENGKWRASISPVENDLGACVTSRNGEVGQSGIVYYICKSKKWTEATVLEYDTYGKACSKDGYIVNGEINPVNKYVCDADTFRTASDVEITLEKGCTSYTVGVVIRKQISEKLDSSFVCENNLWVGGTLIDLRNKKVYKTVVIGNQTWMAENLNFEYKVKLVDRDDSISYGICNTDSCSKYGRYYTWASAMDSAGVYSTNGSGCGYGKTCLPTYPVRGICPEGWHLPTIDEWKTLYSTMGSSPYAMQAKGYAKWTRATDAYGFSALPAGRYETGYPPGFEGVGLHASFWSATERESDYAYYWFLYEKDAFPSEGNFKKDFYSVRCVKDSQ